MKTVHSHSLLKHHRLQYYLKSSWREKGSGEPNKTKVASVTKDQVREIAQTKMQDLNAADEEAAMRIIEGTARSMGITVE